MSHTSLLPSRRIAVAVAVAVAASATLTLAGCSSSSGGKKAAESGAAVSAGKADTPA